MVGNKVMEDTFKKKKHVIMANKVSAKIDGEPILMDPQVLFQH